MNSHCNIDVVKRSQIIALHNEGKNMAEIARETGVNKNISFDIMGGQLTEIEKFPHAVALFVESDEDPNVGRGCGASVINQEVLLTAASCVTTTRDKVEAYTGHKYMWKGMVSMVHRIRKHPEFDEEGFFNDIALMSLQKPLVLGTTVGRVVLLRSPRNWLEEIAGFGASELGKRSYLKFVQQKILTRRACLKHLEHVPRGTFCARHPHGYPAYDDAGSALVQRRFIQTGLLSFENIPDRTFAIYTNVSFHYNWVTTTTNELLCNHKHPETSEEGAEDHHSEYSDNAPDYSSRERVDNPEHSQKSDYTYTVEETEHGWESYDQGKLI